MVLTIVTTNADKAALLAACLPGHEVRRLAIALAEPQADSVRDVARAKAAQAFAHVGGPVLVEDSGIAIPSLRGFPGPYTKYALATLGAAGLAKLAGGQPCRYESALALVRDGEVELCEHAIDGTIATSATVDDLFHVFVHPDPEAAYAALQRAFTAWLSQRPL